jgi:hypothetical protein
MAEVARGGIAPDQNNPIGSMVRRRDRRTRFVFPAKGTV